ncbi:MAG: tetratricopeptide repeat protein [Planctomycetaceae bacterium]|nr:tetratricopeptide repeat protein [Planctomycetaceae bacterium]
MNESGQNYYRHGNYAMAQREFRKAVYDDPENPHYLYNLAAATQKQGNMAEAEQLYQQALQIDPSHHPSYHGMATLMMQQGRTEEAEQMVSAWAGSQPYSSDAYIELGWLQNQMGQADLAEASYQQSLRLNPGNDHAIAQLGQLYESQGRTQDAAAMYEKALFLDPTQQSVHSRLTALYDQHPELEQQQMGYGWPEDSSMMASHQNMPQDNHQQYTQANAWNTPWNHMAAAPYGYETATTPQPFDWNASAMTQGYAPVPQTAQMMPAPYGAPHWSSSPVAQGYPMTQSMPMAQYQPMPQYPMAQFQGNMEYAQPGPTIAPQYMNQTAGSIPQWSFTPAPQTAASPVPAYDPVDQMSQGIPQVSAF